MLLAVLFTSLRFSFKINLTSIKTQTAQNIQNIITVVYGTDKGQEIKMAKNKVCFHLGTHFLQFNATANQEKRKRIP